MPVQEIEPGEVQLSSSYPPDARPKRQRNQNQRKHTKDGALVPVTRMDQPGPDPSQFAPQKKQQPKAHHGMQQEDEPVLWEPTNQTDQAGYQAQDGGQRKAPIGKARRHESLSL